MNAADLRKGALGGSGKAILGTGIAGSALSALSTAPGQMSHLFRRRFPTVAVTGMTGVGKTLLADRLAKQSASEVSVDVGSATMERRTRYTSRLHGFRLRVVPGDNAATRLGALDEVFHDEPVDGVLHVVAYGHATPRRTAGVSGSGQATREQQLAAELEDWSITAHRIAAMCVRRDRPVWLVIVVTKADLFADDIEAAVHYYSPGSGSPFAAKLEELRALAGGARLSVDVLAVSSQTDKSRKELNKLLTTLEKRIGQLSGHL